MVPWEQLVCMTFSLAKVIPHISPRLSHFSIRVLFDYDWLGVAHSVINLCMEIRLYV